MNAQTSVMYPSVAARIPEFLPRAGLQFELQHGIYAVGDLCRTEKLEGIRLINVGPEDDHWRATFETTVLESKFDEAAVVICAPKNRVREMQARLLPQVIKGKTKDGVVREINLTHILVVPEATAHALAFKTYLESIDSKSNAMVVSIGHGTVECGIADDNGVISETLASYPIGTAVVAEAVKNRILELGGKALIGEGTTGYWDDVIIDVHSGHQRSFSLAYSAGTISPDQVKKLVFDELHKYAAKLSSTVRGWWSPWRDRPSVLFPTGGGPLLGPVKVKLTATAEADNLDVMDVSKDSSLQSAAVGCREIGKLKFPHQNIIAIDQGNR
ncbi:MAG: hypothetical protein M3Q07_27820, partial [Pseudobdellovibrionaceae bacterium]|nr:hypothetical protein [Pseudobdellovibrionaceae bacterium]